MFTRQGIAVCSLVSVDSSCHITTTVDADGLVLEFGPTAGSLSLAVSEDVVGKLMIVFADAHAHLTSLRAAQDALADDREPGRPSQPGQNQVCGVLQTAQ